MTKRRIALVQPHIAAGSSLGIEKSPESIQSLAGQLKREGHKVQMYHEKADDRLYQDLAQFSPDYVALSTMTANFPEGKKVAREVKNMKRSTPVFLGGWHASGGVISYIRGQENETLGEILNTESPFDYVGAGEGELLLPEMIRRLEAGQLLDDLKGVGYLKNGTIKASVSERIRDLDALADPDWDGLDVTKYRDKRTGALDLSVHFNRACRFLCGFCPTASIYGKGVSSFSPERSVEYMAFLLDKFGPQVLTFTDEDFFANPKWVERLVQLMNQYEFNQQYGVQFDTFASVNDLYKLEKNDRGDFLDDMKNTGFGSFTMGVESLRAQILRKYNKELMILPMMTSEEKEIYRHADVDIQDRMLVSIYSDRVQRAVNFAHKHRLLVVGDYIVGNPDETEEQTREGFTRFSGMNNLYVAYIPVYTPFPGTDLWKEAYDSGKLKRDKEGNIDWASFDASKGALDLDYDVKGLRDRLEIEFYTSDRYQADMRQELSFNPESIGMFKGRFNYLNNLFPGNTVVEETVRYLE